MIAQRRRHFTVKLRQPQALARAGPKIVAARFSKLEFAFRVFRAGHRGDKQPGRGRGRHVQLRRAPGTEEHQPRRSQGQGGRHHGLVRVRKNHAPSPDRRGAPAHSRRRSRRGPRDHQAAQRLARRDLDRRDPRRGRSAGTGRLRLLHVHRKGRVSRHSRPDSRRGAPVASPVRLRRARRAGAVPLSGAGVSAGPARAMTGRIAELMRALGARIVNNWVWRLGVAIRFLWLTLRESGPSFRRFHLTIREIYFAGVLSLVVIMVSGLFVGMVLGLQGYDTLVRFGSSEVLGTLVALTLVRELGPVVAGLLFASRAGSAITAEIGLMKAAEQLAAMEMIAVGPIARVVAPRFWAGVIS